VCRFPPSEALVDPAEPARQSLSAPARDWIRRKAITPPVTHLVTASDDEGSSVAAPSEQAPAHQHVREQAREINPACARSLENRSATARLARLSANERCQNPAKKR